MFFTTTPDTWYWYNDEYQMFLKTYSETCDYDGQSWKLTGSIYLFQG